MQTFEQSGEFEPHVQFIEFAHHGAFVLRYVVQRVIDGRLISQTRLLGRSRNQQTLRVDLATLRFHNHALEVGDHARLRIGAAGGVRRNGPLVAYAPNGETARFVVRGTTLAFTIRQA